ncbi:MAG: OmpA family protein [Desertimonas sp.]
MDEHRPDHATFVRRRITLGVVLAALIALAAVLVVRLGGTDESSSAPSSSGPAGSVAPAMTSATTGADDDAPVRTTEHLGSTAGSDTADPMADTAAGPDTAEVVRSTGVTVERAATVPAPPSAPEPTDAPTTEPIPTTEPVVTTVERPDTPPDEVTVEVTDEGATMTGLISSSSLTGTVAAIVEMVVPGTVTADQPYGDRTYLDDTLAGDELTVILTDLRGVGFARDTYDEMPDDLAETLDGVASVLGQHPDATVVLIGHAITDGDDDNDRAVAIERAETARRYLVDAGVDEERLTTFGAGEAGTIPTSNETSINRRIDYVFDGLSIG